MPIYLPTSIQESGRAANRMRSAGVQPPLPTAFDVTGGLSLSRVAVTATAFRAAFGCMYAAAGVSGNINTATFFLNKTRAWRTRTITITDTGPTVSTNTWSQAASTYSPTVVQTGPLYSPTDQIFNNPSDDWRNWVIGGGHTPGTYDGVSTDSEVTAQAVDGATWDDTGVTGRKVVQALTNEDSASTHVSDMRTFLAGLTLTDLWGASPPVIYHDYVYNFYPASCGDYNNPSFANLSSTYTDYNCDITNLAADRATYVNYAYGGFWYPIPNFSTDEILPGAYGSGIDVGTAMGISAIGIIGDALRCRVGLMAHVGDSSPAGWSVICDRIQYMTQTMVNLTMVEVGYGYGNGSASSVTFVKHISEQLFLPGAIFEIPQASFTAPFISTQGGVDYCIASMDSVMLVNSRIDVFASAIGATIVSGW